MRAKEFTINVPINIRLGDDDEPELIEPVASPEEPKSVELPARPAKTSCHSDDCDEEEDDVMVPPLQQQVELQKAALGKDSEVIDDLTDEDDIDQEDRDEPSDPQKLDLSSFWDQTPIGH